MPWASSATSMPVSELTAWASNSACLSVSSRSATAVPMYDAPRVFKSAATAASFGIARDKEQLCALRCPDAAGGLGDSGGGAEDENLLRDPRIGGDCRLRSGIDCRG